MLRRTPVCPCRPCAFDGWATCSLPLSKTPQLQREFQLKLSRDQSAKSRRNVHAPAHNFPGSPVLKPVRDPATRSAQTHFAARSRSPSMISSRISCLIAFSVAVSMPRAAWGERAAGVPGFPGRCGQLLEHCTAHLFKECKLNVGQRPVACGPSARAHSVPTQWRRQKAHCRRCTGQVYGVHLVHALPLVARPIDV